ncbi:hypothetical protein HanIR_Chr13g0641211 [Helianthus annuus]|nr:hypothetical protein HanIR_Chr13g0641211 [Helianthus annuus]
MPNFSLQNSFKSNILAKSFFSFLVIFLSSSNFFSPVIQPQVHICFKWSLATICRSSMEMAKVWPEKSPESRFWSETCQKNVFNRARRHGCGSPANCA